MEEHESSTYEGATPAASLETVGPADNFQLDGARHGLILRGRKKRMSLGKNPGLETSLGDNLDPLPFHTAITLRKSSKLHEVLQRFLLTTLGGEPAWRKGEEDGADAEDDAGKDLDEEGELPGPVAIHVFCGVCDPEGDDNAEDDKEGFEDKEGAANFGGRDFADVEGDDHGEPGGIRVSRKVGELVKLTVLHKKRVVLHANTDTTDKSSCNEHVKVDSCSLKSRSNSKDDNGNHDRPLARRPVGDPALVHGTDKGTKRNHSRHQTLLEAGAGSIVCNLRKPIQKVFHDERDADNALVVAKEEAADGGEGCAEGYVGGREETAEAWTNMLEL